MTKINVIYQCDRCKENITDVAFVATIAPHAEYTDDAAQLAAHTDLCRSCVSAFHDWVQRGESRPYIPANTARP